LADILVNMNNDYVINRNDGSKETFQPIHNSKQALETKADMKTVSETNNSRNILSKNEKT